MISPASPASPLYGLGWLIDAGSGTVWHSGSTPGFESLATMAPAENTGAVVPVNGGSGIGFGETTQLRNGITAAALGLDDGGEGSRWPQQALFLGLVLLPVVYLFAMVWAWRHRAAVRAKSTNAFGRFSLWFSRCSPPSSRRGSSSGWYRPCSAPHWTPCACSSPTAD